MILRLPLILFLLCALTHLTTLNAQNKTWLGNTTNWHTASNWSPSGVPGTSNNVIIPNTGIDPIISAAAVAKSLEIREDAALSINVSLTVSDSDAFFGGVSNSGQITNNGTFTVTNSPVSKDAILNNPTGSIVNNGEMNIRPVNSISSAGTAGLENHGSVNNMSAGEIYIDEAFRGIINGTSTEAGSFTNSGDIIFGSLAFLDASALNNSAISTFTNESSGKIYINDINATGLNNTGGFTNKGMISVGDSDDIIGAGILNSGTFLNDAGANIQVDRTSLSGCDNRSSFTNKGEMYLGGANGIQDGLRTSNGGTFTNETEGDLMINNTNTSGINVFGGGMIVNKGNLHIGNSTLISTIGIQGSAQFENAVGGILNIDNTQTVGISFSGIFDNYGQINIGSIGNIGANGLSCSSGGTCTNYYNANININNTTNASFKNAGNFSNQGQISIGQIGTSPIIGFENTSGFTNEASGVIHIQASFLGCNNFTGGTLTNKGHIEIGSNSQSVTTGILNQVNSQLTNDGGQLMVYNTTSTGLNNAFSSSAVLNKACSYIYLEGRITNAQGTFQNDGFLSLNTAQTHLPGNFTNNGVVEDLEGTFPLGGGLVNNEIILQAVAAPCNDITPAFVLGGSIGFNIIGVFTNAACTASAGNYNAITNTFTPNNQADGNYTYYVKVEDPTGMCTEVLSWKVTLTTPVPQAFCKNKTVQLDASGNASIITADIDNNSTDACGIASYDLNQDNFGCAQLGNNTVTLTVTNLDGNTHFCNAVVTVEDNSIPTVICKNKTVEIQPDATYTLMESDVFDNLASSDNCGITNVNFTAATYDCDDIGGNFSIFVLANDAAGNSNFCNANINVIKGDALPSNWNTTNIGTSTGNDFEFDPCVAPMPENGEFTITGGGNNATSSTTDNVAFASQYLCGNVSITAKVEHIDGNGYGGLMIRETLDANAKQVSLFSNQTNFLLHHTRYTTGGAKQVNAFFKPNPLWLRLQRQGDWIFSYYSQDGVNFQVVHGVYVPMSYCVEIGLASYTYLPNSQTEAVFSNVSTSGDNSSTLANEDEFISKSSLGIASSIQVINGKVFPNPASDYFTLQLETSTSLPVNVEIFNAYGQVIENRILNPGVIQQEWNVTNWPSGNYTLRISIQGETAIVRPFVVY